MALWQQVAALQQQVQALQAQSQQLETQMQTALKLLAQIQTAVIPPVAVSASLTLRGSKGDILMQLKDNEPGSYQVQLKDAAGNPATIDPAALPVWAITDPSLATLTPSADGLSCAVQPSGKLGTATIQFSIPAVDDEPAIQASDDLTIIASVATQAVLVGTPG